MEYKNLPDLKALATLVAVVELGGVAEAGRRLHIGQPAVTKRLRSLDACYGVDIMQREGRRLELTAAGEKVHTYAQLVMNHQGMLLTNLETMRAGRNHLTLETTPDIGDHLLPEILFSFDEAHPEYKIESRMGYSRRIQSRLATGLADMGLLEQAPDHPDILAQKWIDDEIILVCGNKHEATLLGEISLEALQQLKFVLREPASSARMTLQNELSNIGINSLPVTMEVGSTDAIIEMLERGKHVSFLPMFAISDVLESGVLHHIRVQGLRINRTLWIARTRSNLNNPVTEAFIQILRNV